MTTTMNQDLLASLLYQSGGMRITPAVSQTQSYLRAVMSGKPDAYQSRYETQIADLYDQIMNRPRFTYDMNRDPLFQQYREQYLREGRRAMEDTVGQSAALTGGYGNSWAGTAGYQAFGNYLQGLNDKIPELEQRARERYNEEGDTLRGNADLLLDLDNRDYGWYRDAMGDWQFDAKLALEQDKFNFEKQKYWNEMMAKLGLNGGGSGGGGGGGGRSSSKSSGKKSQGAVAEKQELIHPVLPKNVAEKATNPNAPAVLSSTSAKGYIPKEWADTQARMQALSVQSFPSKAQAAAQTAGSLTNLMVNAAQNGTVRNAVLNRKKKGK